RAPDERIGLAKLRRHRRERFAVECEAFDAVHGARGVEESLAFVRGNGELLGETLRQPPGRPALVRLDLAYGVARAVHRARKRFLREIERFAAPPQPVAKR